MVMKIFMIFLLLQIASMYTFQERPQIQKEECPVKLQDLKYDLIFFSKLEAINKYKPIIDQLDVLKQNLEHLFEIIKEPNQKLLDTITQSQIQNKGLYVTDYEESIEPEDLQAIQYYKILKELGKKYQSVSDSIFDGTFFLQFFERDLNKFINSLNKSKQTIINLSSYSIGDIQKESAQLQRDYKICTGSIFNMMQQSIEFDKQLKTKKHKAHNKKSSHKHSNKKNQKVAPQFIQWNYVEYEPVKIEECEEYIHEIEEDFLEFLKIQELLKYKRSQQEYKDIINYLDQNKEEFIKNANIISKAKKNVKIDNLLQGKGLKYYVSLGSENQLYGYNKDYQVANEAISYLDQIYHDLDDLINFYDKPRNLLGISLETFQFLKQKNLAINDYLDKQFSYQEEEVYRELLQINRDYKICNGKKKYEDKIFKLQKQNEVKAKQNDEKKEIILSPPIEKQNCQQQLPDIIDNILYYLKLKVVKQFGLLIIYYQQIMNDISDQQNNIINNNRQLNNWFQDLKLESTLVFIEYVISNSKPDDVDAVKAYDNLDKLNNRLTSLQKYYLDAKNFLSLSDKDFQYLNEQFDKLKQQIDYSKYKNVDIQKDLLKNLNDYNICTQKDFIKEYNLQIEDKSHDNFSYSFYKDKNKFVKQINSFIQQDTTLLQLGYEWKYYDYAPIEKHECKEELPIIKEDILQFQKIQKLYIYQTKNQKSYDILIDNVLNFKQDFQMNAKRGKEIMNKLDFTRRLRFFNDYPKNIKQSNNPEILIVFDKIHEYINKLGNFDQQLSSCIWLYHFDDDDFTSIKQSQLILNDYLNKRFNYKMNEVEKELTQLYRDYQICTGKSYFEQSQAQKEYSNYGTGYSSSSSSSSSSSYGSSYSGSASASYGQSYSGSASASYASSYSGSGSAPNGSNSSSQSISTAKPTTTSTPTTKSPSTSTQSSPSTSSSKLRQNQLVNQEIPTTNIINKQNRLQGHKIKQNIKIHHSLKNKKKTKQKGHEI